MISRFLILRYQCTDTRISNLIMFQTCLFPNVSQVTYLLPKVENAILTDYMCKKTTTTKYICNLICIPNGEFAFKEIYHTHVAPSKFDTVMYTPESGMSLHSISYEI